MNEATIVEALVFLALAGLIGVGGVVVGMLVAPRLGRLTDEPDEEPGGDDD